LRWCNLKKSCSWKRAGPKLPFGSTGSDHAIGRHRTSNQPTFFLLPVSGLIRAPVREFESVADQRLMTPERTRLTRLVNVSAIGYRPLDPTSGAHLMFKRIWEAIADKENPWFTFLIFGVVLALAAFVEELPYTGIKIRGSGYQPLLLVFGALLLVAAVGLAVYRTMRPPVSPAIQTGAALAISGFKATIKKPKPDKKYAPPIKLTGTINKKLPDGLKLWLVNEGHGVMRWPQKEVNVQSDKDWSVEYDPKNFSDNDKRTLRIYVVGQTGLALLQAYYHINKFHKKDVAQRLLRRRNSRAARGGRSGITPLTEDIMKPVSPTISFRLSKAP
jgi:hypothetical protein